MIEWGLLHTKDRKATMVIEEFDRAVVLNKS
jgi:hypothetical protein